MRDRDGEGPLGTAGRREYPSRPAPGIAPPASRAGRPRVHPGSVVLGQAAGRASGEAPRLARTPGTGGPPWCVVAPPGGFGAAAGARLGRQPARDGTADGPWDGAQPPRCAHAPAPGGAEPPCGPRGRVAPSCRVTPSARVAPHRRAAPNRRVAGQRRPAPGLAQMSPVVALSHVGAGQGRPAMLGPPSATLGPPRATLGNCRRGHLLIGWAVPDMRLCQSRRHMIKSPVVRRGMGRHRAAGAAWAATGRHGRHSTASRLVAAQQASEAEPDLRPVAARPEASQQPAARRLRRLRSSQEPELARNGTCRDDRSQPTLTAQGQPALAQVRDTGGRRHVVLGEPARSCGGRAARRAVRSGAGPLHPRDPGLDRGSDRQRRDLHRRAPLRRVQPARHGDDPASERAAPRRARLAAPFRRGDGGRPVRLRPRPGRPAEPGKRREPSRPAESTRSATPSSSQAEPSRFAARCIYSRASCPTSPHSAPACCSSP